MRWLTSPPTVHLGLPTESQVHVEADSGPLCYTAAAGTSPFWTGVLLLFIASCATAACPSCGKVPASTAALSASARRGAKQDFESCPQQGAVALFKCVVAQRRSALLAAAFSRWLSRPIERLHGSPTALPRETGHRGKRVAGRVKFRQRADEGRIMGRRLLSFPSLPGVPFLDAARLRSSIS
jgi:hypothetical protein